MRESEVAVLKHVNGYIIVQLVKKKKKFLCSCFLGITIVIVLDHQQSSMVPTLALIQLPGQETKTKIARKAAGNKSGSLKKQDS